MGTREEVLSIVKKILIGPNPLPEFKQENGEEILFCDTPLKTYVTGILFPQVIMGEGIQDENEQTEHEESEETDAPEETIGVTESQMVGDKNIAEPSIEAETSKINNFRQSAMGITLCIPDNIEFADIKVSVGEYFEKMSVTPVEKKDDTGKREIVWSEKTKTCYCRRQIDSVLRVKKNELPTSKYKRYQLNNNKGEVINGLEVFITFRLSNSVDNYTIYTVTLINTKKNH